MDEGSVAPVVIGLAVGIAFVVLFSIFGSSVPSFKGLDNERISITIHDVKNAYQVGEPISFTINTEGISDNLCNGPKLHVQIIRIEDGKGVWNTPPTFQTAMGCGNLQGIDTEWRFGYPGEELPYQSALTYDKYYENNIAMEKAGAYKMVAEFDDHVIEKEFFVTGSSSTQEDAHDFAIEITRDLSEVQEFFSTYPDANTTVYFITTCAYEPCSTLWRIPSVVEYWYKAEDQKYAELRVTIDYQEGEATFSQVSCSIYGSEDESVGMYGAVSLEGVAEFLRDSHCPDN